MGDIPERDWKTFSPMAYGLYDRLYERLCGEMAAVLSDESKNARAKFYEIHEFVRAEEKRIDRLFGRHARSQALNQISLLRGLGLITDEEFARFSEPTREWVEKINELRRRYEES